MSYKMAAMSIVYKWLQVLHISRIRVPLSMPNALPDEILCEIICHLPIRCIVLLRQVSKRLNAITYERSIWVHVYRISTLVRPGGPYTWQTTQMLESHLIQSTKLSRNWPPNDDAKPIRSRVINSSLLRNINGKLVLGRWLFAYSPILSARILCYDLDGAENSAIEEPYSVLYEWEKDCKIVCMEFVQTLLTERSGDKSLPVGFILATVCNDVSSLTTRTLYSVILADGMFPTLQFVLRLNPSVFSNALVIGPRLLAIYSNPSDANDALFVDIESYRCYKFPESVSSIAKQLVPQGYCRFNSQEIVISSTHVLLIRPYRDVRQPGKCLGTYIQAYAIPSPQGSGSGSLADQALPSLLTLQLTHEGAIDLNLSGRCPLLRDTEVDQIANTIRIVVSRTLLLEQKASAMVRLTLNPVVHGIGSITFEPPTNTIEAERSSRALFLPSLNGSTRAVKSFLRGNTMGIRAMVIDDEDSANTHTAADNDMRCFQELSLNSASHPVGFDMYRG
ncbi:hypothetical protein BJ138DRAFT_1168506, partial [Hygrophoropsis aurantiaca]